MKHPAPFLSSPLPHTHRPTCTGFLPRAPAPSIKHACVTLPHTPVFSTMRPSPGLPSTQNCGSSLNPSLYKLPTARYLASSNPDSSLTSFDKFWCAQASEYTCETPHPETQKLPTWQRCLLLWFCFHLCYPRTTYSALCHQLHSIRNGCPW